MTDREIVSSTKSHQCDPEGEGVDEHKSSHLCCRPRPYFTYGSVAVDQSRHDEAQAHLCAVPSFFGARLVLEPPSSTARVQVRRRGLMNQSRSNVRSLVRGGAIGAAAAVAAFGGVYGALAATQAGITEAQKPAKSTTVQAGIVSAQASAPRATVRAAAGPATARVKPVVQQAGIAESTNAKGAKKDDDNREGRVVEEQVSSDTNAPQPPAQQQAPAPAPQAPVQQAPAPVRQAPVQQAPAPVRQAPAPAPAPVQQAPAPAPGLTIDLGGRAPVVPQAPIAPKQLHIG